MAEVGGIEDANVLAAALLHDTVEDTDTTRKELREQFGAVIDEMVAEVTDDKTLESQVRKDAQVAHAPHLTDGAKVIKIADKHLSPVAPASAARVVKQLAHAPDRLPDYSRMGEKLIAVGRTMPLETIR